MRIISTYVDNTKKVRSLEDVKLDNQLWGVKRTLSYFLLVANNKTIHSPTSRIIISFHYNSLKIPLSSLSVDCLN